MTRRTESIAGVLVAGLLLGSPGAGLAEARSTSGAASSASDYSAAALLAEIRSRQTVLDRRERDLESREANVSQLENEVADMLVELEEIRNLAEKRISAWEDQAGDRVRRLAKIYAAMAPGRAAPLLEALDVGLATRILAKMKDKQSAAVLSLISEKRAIAMSLQVAHPLRSNPGDSSDAVPARSERR